MDLKNNTLGIYIHVPFCESKCPYCDFYSVFPCETENYVKKICSEIERWGKSLNKTVDTIYFGGGTPSLLKSDSIYEIINSIKNNFKVSNAEITMEINPADYMYLDFEKLKYHGLNRISIGAQSMNDDELKALGRRHNSEDVFSTYNQIKFSGIKNISFDIMLGIPYQNEKSISEFLNFCQENNIPHISAYLLKVEKGTPFYENQKILNLPNEDKSADIYAYVCNILKQFGYNHYEISNFAFPGFESRHNLKYWNLEEYLGIGPSAHSLINNKRFYYSNDVNNFLLCKKTLNEGRFEPKKEYIMLRLRLLEGLTNKGYKEHFGEDIPEIYFKRVKKYIKLGFIVCDNHNIKITEKGFLLSNYIISDILG